MSVYVQKFTCIGPDKMFPNEGRIKGPQSARYSANIKDMPRAGSKVPGGRIRPAGRQLPTPAVYRNHVQLYACTDTEYKEMPQIVHFSLCQFEARSISEKEDMQCMQYCSSLAMN